MALEIECMFEIILDHPSYDSAYLGMIIFCFRTSMSCNVDPKKRSTIFSLLIHPREAVLKADVCGRLEFDNYCRTTQDKISYSALPAASRSINRYDIPLRKRSQMNKTFETTWRWTTARPLLRSRGEGTKGFITPRWQL